ncbi:MAG: ABC transporter ATP-binding protein [Alphaproteobacteria bacterium]
MADLKLQNIVKRFGNIEVIHGVDLEIEHREFIVLVGPSGCGKSTLLRLIAGLEEITEGNLLIDGVDVTQESPSNRGIAMVFQSYALYPHMTVEQNMGFGLKMSGTPAAEIKERVAEVARILQLEPLLDRKPKAMSGGQRQRVAIGRALVRNPKVFLFDEPLSNLDAELRVQMRVEIARLHNELDATMVYVTHDQVEAMTLADRIVILRSGWVEQVGSPMELYHHPDNCFAAQFIGSPKMNLLDSEIKAVGEGNMTVSLPDGNDITIPVDTAQAKIGDRVKLGIRPEHCAFGDDAEGIHMKVKVDVSERLGGETFLYGTYGDGKNIVMKASGADRTERGSKLEVKLDPRRCYVFEFNAEDESKGKAFKRLDPKM